MKPPYFSLVNDWDLPLKSARLQIRRFTLEDEPQRQQWAKFTDPFLAKYNFTPQDATRNEVQFERLTDRLRLALDNARGELVGYISLKPLPRRQDAAELGICFAADQVNKGYGREALTLLLPYLCTNLNLKHILLEVDAVNQRALRLYQLLGFQQVDIFWKKEENRQMKACLPKNGEMHGYRWRGRYLEISTLVMKWTYQI